MIRSARLAETGMVVRDLELSLEWYSEHFGLEVLHEVSNGVIIGKPGVMLWLAEADDADSARAINTAHDICIRLVGFEVEADDFARIGEEFGDQDDIIEVDHPLYRSCIIEDPDGHTLELFIYK